jgi:hypothetical protein
MHKVKQREGPSYNETKLYYATNNTATPYMRHLFPFPITLWGLHLVLIHLFSFYAYNLSSSTFLSFPFPPFSLRLPNSLHTPFYLILLISFISFLLRFYFLQLYRLPFLLPYYPLPSYRPHIRPPSDLLLFPFILLLLLLLSLYFFLRTVLVSFFSSFSAS